MDVEGKEASSPAEGDLLWPSHDVEDPSQTFLNSERAKYHPKPQFALLFTWTGFQEKLHWIFAYFFAPCAAEGELRESPHPGVSDDDENTDEVGLETEQSASTFVSSAAIQLGREKSRNEYDVTPSPNYDEEYEAPDSEEKFEECATTQSVSQIVASIEGTNVHDIEHKIPENLDDTPDSEDNPPPEDLPTDDEGVYTHRLIELDTVVELQSHEELFSLAPSDLDTTDTTQQAEVSENEECHSKTENELKNLEEGELYTVQEELNLTTSYDAVTEVTFVEEGDQNDTKVESPQEQSSESSSSSSSSDEIEYITKTAIEITGNESSDSAVERDDNSDANEIIDAELIKDTIEDSTTTQIQQRDLEAEITAFSESQEEDTAFDDTPTSETQQEEQSQPNIPTIAITEVDVEEVEYSKQATDDTTNNDEKQLGGDATSSYSSSSLRSSKKGDRITKVDKTIKRTFQRKVKARVKQVIKSGGMPFFAESHVEGVVVTPTVCRVNQPEKNTLPIQKTELSGSRSSIERISSSNDDFVRLVALIGFEGYGKTMLTKRYAEMASGRIMNVNELTDTGIKRWHPFARKDFFKFVHYIDLRDLPTDGEYTADELLFQLLMKDLTANEAEMGYTWLRGYKKSVLIIVDGVNDVDIFEEGVQKIVSYDEKTSPKTIIYNLLTGGILPNAHVLISSSETNSTRLTDVLRPDKIYVLSGFDRTDIKTYLSKNNAVLKLLTDGTKNNLMASCKVPLGLFYATNALSDGNFRLDSLLGAISHYVRNAMRGKDPWKSDSGDILRKLMKLSHQCSLRDVEVVYDDDITDGNLSVADIANCQLFTEKGVGRAGTNDSMPWIKTFTFSHVTLREYLSALFLAEADTEKLVAFTNEYFSVSRFDFQQKSLYGLLFSDENLKDTNDLVKVFGLCSRLIAICPNEIGIPDFVTVSHLQEKRELLRGALLNRIETKPLSFYLYSIVHECPNGIDDIVKEKLRTLSIAGEKLTTVSMFVMSKVAERVGDLDMLELRRCYPTDDVMKRFLSSANHQNTKIKTLNLRENPSILTAGAAVREICIQCGIEELDIGDCSFHGDVLAPLARILREVKLKTLKIDDNPQASENSVYGIGEFVKKANVRKLSICNSDLREIKLKRLGRSLKHFKLETLDVSKNRAIGAQDTAGIIGDIAHECKLDVLYISDCGITSVHCQTLSERLKAHKLKKLDISALESTEVSNNGLNSLFGLIPCVKEELRLENWQFSPENLQSLSEMVKKDGHKDVTIYYGSEGESI